MPEVSSGAIADTIACAAATSISFVIVVARVEGAPRKDAREREHVVDLVRVVGTPREQQRRRRLPPVRPRASDWPSRRRSRPSPSSLPGRRDGTRCRRPMKTSAPASASSALQLSFSGFVLGEGRLVRREAGTAAVDRTLAVAPDDATGSGGEEHVGRRDQLRRSPSSRSSRPRFACRRPSARSRGRRGRRSRCRAGRRGRRGCRRLFRRRASISKRRGGDVLEVDPTEPRGDRLADRDDLVRVLGCEHSGQASTPPNSLNRTAFPSHHGHRRLRPDVTEAEDGSAVGDHRDGVLLHGEVPGGRGIVGVAWEILATPGVYAIERMSCVS